jgi:hypothetical protein
MNTSKIIYMKILIISEDNSIFSDSVSKQHTFLEYSSFVNELFVIVLTSVEKNLNKAKQMAKNVWLYKATANLKLFRIINAIHLASFEVKAGGVFQADLIVCEDQYVSTIAGYLISKKFKKPLYIFLSEENERKLFNPLGFKETALSKILWFIFKKAECIKVTNLRSQEKLLKKSSSLKVELIKPFIDFNLLLSKSKTDTHEDANENDIIKSKFPQLRFTSTVFVDNIKQLKISLSILEGLNKYFPPTSLIILISNNLNIKKVNNFIDKKFKNFVYIEPINDDLINYISQSNAFWGVSQGEKYEEILSKACALGAKIIALKSDISTKFIDDDATGYICPISSERDEVNYFVTKNLFLMKNPIIGLNFKVNLPFTFKKQFNETEEDYINKLKDSFKGCIEKFKIDHAKYYG